ncbi:cyclin-dependent kinase 5 activator 2b [Salminus brasiliensis]|uniref:cyclin-dependent kinase 5 activator 2b n=1 Tax=Salminus brasiliensis TaxID=930266 RepID=UPI003B832AB8
MGTVLSISPSSGKGSGLDDGSELGNESSGKVLKKPSVIVSTFAFKRLVTASAKKKNVMKVNPNPVPAPLPPPPQPQNEVVKKPLAVPIPTVPPPQKVEPEPTEVKTIQKQPSTNSLLTRVVVQASAGELLRCLGEFMCRRCFRLKELSPNEVILWFRNVDRTLLMQGWQDQGFITPATLVFVYLLCKETVTEDIESQCKLQGVFLTCLYLAYSYLGNEISYPLKPFISEGNKDVFWEQSLGVIDNMSGKMLQINMDPQFFTEVFQDLKNEGETKKDGSDVER